MPTISNGARKFAAENGIDVDKAFAAHPRPFVSVADVEALLPKGRERPPPPVPLPNDGGFDAAWKQRLADRSTFRGAAAARPCPQPPATIASSKDPLLLNGNTIRIKWGNYTTGERRLRWRTGTVRYRPQQGRNASQRVYLVEFQRRPNTPRMAKGPRLRKMRPEKLFERERMLEVQSTTHVPGHHWTEEEEAALVQRVKMGEARSSVAVALGRSKNSVGHKFGMLTDLNYAHSAGNLVKVSPAVPFPTLIARRPR